MLDKYSKYEFNGGGMVNKALLQRERIGTCGREEQLLEHASLTRSLIFSVRNGLIMEKTALKIIGTFIKWIPRTFNGKESFGK